MKNAIIMSIVMMTVGILITTSAWAMDERSAPEIADAHWTYFGPAPSNDWTAARRLPVKRSLAQSIRHDALRHYEINSFELSESGQVISFSEKLDFFRVDTQPRPAKRQPHELPWEIFELAESGLTIVFPNAKSPAPDDFRVDTRPHPAKHQPGESPWEIFELAESGQTIVFPKAKSPAKVGENVVARKNATLP